MKIYLTLLLSLLTVTSFAKDKITITQQGSEDGSHYDYVHESHDTGLFGINHDLKCKRPGAITCGWVSPPVIGGINVEDLQAFVNDKIANGENSGSTTYNNVVYLSWSYDPDTDLLTITAEEK